jgi:plasmid stabilization system protein ParE
VTYTVDLSESAREDLLRLFDHVLERELQRESGDPQRAHAALDAIRGGLDTLSRSPFTCRKAGADPLMRELVIAFGLQGYVALFEIVDEARVLVIAVRHQLEDDYH